MAARDETPKYFNRPNQTNSLNHVWTVSPNKVNEILATVSLDDVYIPVDQANFLDRTTVGINYPYIFPQGKLIPTRIPTVNMTSFSGLSGGPYPSHSSGPIYTISDSFTWIKGSHTLKFGFNYEKTGENDNDEINVSGLPHLHQQPERAVLLHGYPLRPADHRQCRRQRGAGPVRHLLRTRPARLHHFPRQHVRRFRAGCLEGQPEAARRLWHPLHRHHSDGGSVAEHVGLRSEILRSGEGGQDRSDDRPGHCRIGRQVQRHGDSRATAGPIPPRAASPKPAMPV